MRTDPLVSVAVPAYNHGRYLAECLDSILNQDYPRLEVVVVDDGSTDDTPEVLARYKGLVRFDRQPNAGQSVALTRAWALSAGDVLSYVSADDALRPGAVSSAVEALTSADDVACAYGDFELMGSDSAVLRVVHAPVADLVTMLRRFITVAGPGGFFTRQAYERAGVWDPRFRQNPDVDFLFRLALAGRFVHTHRVMAAFRVHAGSQTRQRPDSTRADEPIAIATKFFARDDIPAEIAAWQRACLSAAHVMSARHHLRGRHWRTFLHRAWRAVQIHPATAISPWTIRLWAGGLR